MDSFVDLFDMLGIAPEVKEETKKVAKKAPAKAKSKAKAKTTLIKLPVEVHTGFYEPFSLTALDFGAEEVKKEELVERVFELHPELNGSWTSYTVDKQKLRVVVQGLKGIIKGEVSLTQDSELIGLGGHVFDLSSIMTDAECKVSVEDIRNLIVSEDTNYGDAKKIKLLVKDRLIVPIPDFDVTRDAKQLPVSVMVWGRSKTIFTEELAESYMGKELDSDSEEEDATKLGVRDLVVNYLRDTYLEFSDEKFLDVRYSKSNNCYVAFLKGEYTTTPAAKTLIPVDGTEISLIFTKIKLTTDMFGGEEEVEEDEIIKYLSKDYPEYSKDRTSIVYDGKKKLIIPILKTSRKGAEVVESEEEIAEALKSATPFLRIGADGRVYRMVNNPIGTFSLATDFSGGKLIYKLPPIPRYLIDTMVSFFYRIMNRCNTEAVLQLFFDQDRECYYIHCPEQKVSYAAVSFSPDNELYRKHYHVLDIHSHGEISCSFSSTDNSDEVATGIYGVVYGLRSKQPHLDFRIGSAGLFAPVDARELIDFDSSESQEINVSLWYSRVKKQEVQYE